METSNEDASHIYPGFSFNLLFKVTEVKLWNFTICSNTLAIRRIFTKFLSWIHLIRIHHILPRFLIWPTFQCSRGQTLFFYDLPQHLNYGWIFTKYLFLVTSNKDTSYVAQVFDLTSFSMSQRKNFEIFMIHKCICTLSFPGLWCDLLLKVTDSMSSAFAWQWTA
jgi:hypothetical protein